MSFSDISKYLRAEKKLSQVELATALNVSKACISMIEIGRNEPTAITLTKYADFFQVSVDYLLGREEVFDVKKFSATKKTPDLTSDEQDLLDDYRSLPHQEQLQAFEYVRYLAEKRGKKKA